ncbi:MULTISPECIES: DUF3263 domain-containing protein [Dietzia]|jgi:hypothetical protein|uniref:DUF3263 domain-containing protein n=1 Tax=Dietzia maris TaxID=37915 RepID=A0ABT8GZN0_9ACTN|nr:MULTISPECIES: DUF3263 domain-containing protein [Dietzia]MCT1432708.1 DUF3263 domain-containing protein [Dietzia maris]MCT1520218.1 DUF3263 domain-containing protein [Dietzia maris]MCZ4540929.1 DUF3263 domain-containing protein [Dietzia maris]MDJ0423634.1 DUF3263 domain-containing protein [Dietzia kunjamensis]MDN4505663.1 DUF3263 domain-containing protein [Dietzia maris]
MGRSATAAREVQGEKDREQGAAELHAADPVLSERDRAMLEFERQWWKFAGSKEEAIRQQFDMSGTRYFQILNDLIDRPEALAADPLLVKRLRRMRSSRQKARAARNLGMRLD